MAHTPPDDHHSYRLHRPVTQTDIARYCGVARSTVSFVLNNDPRVSPEMRQRVQEAIAHLGYDGQRHVAAKRLILQRYGKRLPNHALAMVLPEYAHQANYFQRVLQGVQDALTRAGYALVLGSVTPETSQLPPIFHSGEIDALLLLYAPQDYESIEQQVTGMAHERHLPVISLLVPNGSFACVRADDYQGGYLAAEHLIALGHREMLYIAVGEHVVLEDRARGMAAALADAGLSPTTALHNRGWYLGSINPPDHLIIPQYDADDPVLGFHTKQFAEMLAYLHAHRGITAIIAQNDPLARRIGYLLKQDGYRIPEDISLVGFDDTDPMLDDHGQNILTSVHIPLGDIGQRAVALALEMVADSETPSTVVIPPTLTVRRSTAQV